MHAFREQLSLSPKVRSILKYSTVQFWGAVSTALYCISV